MLVSTPVSSSQWKSHFDTSHWSTPWCVTTPCPLVHPPCTPDHPLCPSQSIPLVPPIPPLSFPSPSPLSSNPPLSSPVHPSQSTPSPPISNSFLFPQSSVPDSLKWSVWNVRPGQLEGPRGQVIMVEQGVAMDPIRLHQVNTKGGAPS